MTRPIKTKQHHARPPQVRKIIHASKFVQRDIDRIENYAHLGLTEEEMAHCFDVTLKTFQVWKRQRPEIGLAIKRGGPDATAHVARAMYLNAIGYEHNEEKVFCNADGDVTRVATIKKYPPNHVSGIFYLKNKDPTRWKDRQELNPSDELKKLIGGWEQAAKRLTLSGDLLDGATGDGPLDDVRH